MMLCNYRGWQGKYIWNVGANRIAITSLSTDENDGDDTILIKFFFFYNHRVKIIVIFLSYIYEFN
jgi:hypothetical protein